jgi:phytoene dehydrogenase-like protein
MRRRDPSRRRRHGRAGAQRGARNPAGGRLSTRALVIGSGADELVAAQLLARAGCNVLVLESGRGRDPLQFEPGWMPPRVARALQLHGLIVQHPDPWIAAPLPHGGFLELSRDMARSVEAIRRISARDAERWPAFCERMARAANLLEMLYAAPPPDPLGARAQDFAQMVGLWLRAHRVGRQGIEDLLRLLPMPVADLLDDWFESDILKGVLGGAGIANLRYGPRAGGTAFGLLHQHVGSPAGVFRPPLSNARRALRALPGVEIRSGAEVTRLRVSGGRIAGVVLAGGEQVDAPIVLSGIDPRRTLLDLLEPGWLDPELARALRHIRSRGATARVSLWLGGAPAFARLAIAPSLDYLERASDEAKYGRISGRPYIEARHVSEGRDRLEVHLQYAPYKLASGEWDSARRAEVGECAVRLLTGHAGTITGCEVQSPHDLEAENGWPEGQAQHAELALDQVLWMRPLPALARYRTPVAGLFLCGPAMHPGPGIVGASGEYCAGEILKGTARAG